MMPEILIYSSTICPYCLMAKRLLDKKGVTYTEINVDREPGQREIMMQRTKRRTVPQIYIGDYHVGGFDDLHHLDQQETAHAFVEFRPWLGQCRFRDCTHRTEPGCAIQAACLEQKISTVRIQSYRTLIEELLRAKSHRFD